LDNQSLMRVKQRIVMTTNTPGWQDIHRLAEESVKQLERQAIDEEDDTKGATLRREAKAARKFINDFFARIESARQVSDEPTADTFLEICMD
jgi:lysyl-tRNA synthetase class I